MKYALISVLLLAGCAANQTPMVPHSSTFGAGVGGYLQGVVAETGADDTVALSGYLSALAEDPSNVSVQLRSMQLALLAGDMDTAERLARALPPEVGAQTLPLLVKAVSNLHVGKKTEARLVLRQLAKRTPTLLQSLAMLGYLRVDGGEDAAKVVKELEAVTVAPAMAGRKHYYVAQLWLQAGDTEKALVNLKAAHAADVGMVWAARALITMYVQRGETAAAEQVWQSMVGGGVLTAPLTAPAPDGVKTYAVAAAMPTLEQRVGEVLLDFGLIAWAQGASVPARQMMTLVEVLMPRDPYAAYYAGMVEEFGGDLNRAAVRYGRVLDDRELGLAAKLRMMDVAYKNGDTAAVKAMMAALLDSYATLAPVQLAVAEKAMALQDYALAAKHYDVMLALLPAELPKEARAQALFGAAAAHERAGNKARAEVLLRQSLTLEPGNAQVLNYLGYMWVEDGRNLDEALLLLRKALAMAPQDGAIVDSVGWAYYMRGDYARALIYMERAAEMEPDDAAVAEHLGDVYDKLQRPADAKRLWRQALELHAASEDQDATLVKRVEKKLR